MSKPIVGTPVWFYPHRSGHGHQPLPGTVTKVHSDDVVNLVVHDENGVPSGVKDVPVLYALGREDAPDWALKPDARPTSHFCEAIPTEGEMSASQVIGDKERLRLEEEDKARREAAAATEAKDAESVGVHTETAEAPAPVLGHDDEGKPIPSLTPNRTDGDGNHVEYPG